MDGRKGNGGYREGAGRKTKAEEQDLIEKLTPLEPLAFKALEKGLKEDKSWAVRLFYAYRWGKPVDRQEILTEAWEQPIFPNIGLEGMD